MPLNTRTVAVTILAVVADGCVGTGEAVTPTSTSPATSPEVVAEPSTTTTPAEPFQDAHPDFDFEQNGLIAPVWNSAAYGTDAFAELLEELVATGAEWVTLVPTWYQADLTTSEIQPAWQDRTPTDDSLGAAFRLARSLGLRVTLKPHLDPAAGEPRAAIEPSDVDAWFASYASFIVHYAKLAEDLGADQFIIGTELAGTVGDTQHWLSVINDIRSIYSGPILYAANYDEYQRIEFWDALDAIGVDAFYPLAEEPTTDVERLVDAWKPIVAELAALSSDLDRPVVFTEAGYTSQVGTVTVPHDPWPSSVLSEEEQVAGVTALLRSFEGEQWFAGTHWWMWFDYVGDEFAKSLGHTPQGKPAEDVLKKAWSSVG